MGYDCALVSSYKTMIKVGIMMDTDDHGGADDMGATLVLKAVGGKGETHILFSHAADNFTSAFRVSSLVSALLSTNLTKEVAVQVAQRVSTALRSTQSVAPEGAAVSL